MHYDVRDQGLLDPLPALAQRAAVCSGQLVLPVWLHEAARHDCAAHSAPATAPSIWDELAGLRRTPLHCRRPVASVAGGAVQWA